jgi:molecular chaperone GrpE (heat shock protein)
MKCRIFVVLLGCTFLCSCSKSPPTATDTEKRTREETTEARIQEETAKIAAERERLAELQQEQREKVATDLTSRADTREAKRAANLERAAAEQARREGITTEVKGFVDDIQVEAAK